MSKDIVFKCDEGDTNLLLEEFFQTYPFYEGEAKAKITTAWHFLLDKCGGRIRSCGRPYYLHPLRIAFILALSEFDADCIVSGILHCAFDLDVTEEEIETYFGKDVLTIIQGSHKFSNLSISSKTLSESDAIRKMLFAMTDDVRVIFVRLADRLDRIRNISSMESSRRKSLASEVIDIWAPLADRLGMQNVKNELEDLSLKYTNPDAFQQIKAVVSQKKGERAFYLNSAVSKIEEEARKLGLDVTIQSRAKHFYSIYQKMRKRNKEPGELYDLLALRIICQKKNDCYALIGIVHGLWTPLEGRFKDYIAMPKANGYQSLHTTVMCEDRPLEIQIRTVKMHEFAEHGLASHWLYKKGMTHDTVDVKDLSIFNQLNKLKDELSNDDFHNYKDELLKDEIVVFTPKGEVKKLPVGSCAIDFAYAIHTAIGEKIVGAKADGKIISLTQELKNTQIIEILTNPQAHPTPNQLKAVKTARARSRINAYLQANDPAFGQVTPPVKEEKTEVRHRHKKGTGAPEKIVSDKVIIADTKNMFMTFAKCCNPKPGDVIAGYVSRNRGITIHRADCYTYRRIQDLEHRSIPVSWEHDSSNQ